MDARRGPKLAEITTEEQFLNWLAETIQQKATKENSGFVQIEAVKRTSGSVPHLVVTSPSKRVMTLALDLKVAR